MAETLSKQEAINEIVKEAKKLDKLELQILLAHLRVKKMLRQKQKPVAGYNSNAIKMPTMSQIDKWKHESRKQNANR